jgi:hypothetical protein
MRPNKIGLFLLAATLIGALTAPGAAQTPRKKARPVAIQTDVPYQITLGDAAPDHGVVTLAVGALTTLFTPEPVLQFNCGRPETLDVKQSDDQAKFHAVYLRPVRAAESVTISIEMPSGLVSFFARIVDVPSGAKAGNYSGEILVEPKFHAAALARLKADAAALQSKLGDAERRALQAEYERTQARGVAVKARAEGVDAARRETLALLQRAPHPKPTLERRERGWTLSLLGAPLGVADGSYFIFQLRHDGKRPAAFDGVQVQGRDALLGREPGPLPPKQSMILTLFVAGDAPAALDFILDGAPLSLSPPPVPKGVTP